MNIIVTSRARSNSPPNVQFGDDACHGKSAFNFLCWHTHWHVHAHSTCTHIHTDACKDRRRKRHRRRECRSEHCKHLLSVL